MISQIQRNMSMNLYLLCKGVTACKVSNRSEQNLPDINLYLALYSSFEIWWQMQKCSITGAAKAMHSTLSNRHCLMAAERVMVALEQMRIGCCHNVIIGNLVIMQTNRLQRQKFCTWGWNQQRKTLTKPLKPSSHVCWMFFFFLFTETLRLGFDQGDMSCVNLSNRKTKPTDN